jgi:LCP family protein required for cell wall assembly
MAGVFDVNAGTVNVVSIPRDTCANVDSNPKNGETKKISGVYARADYEGLRDAVADMCGFPIDCYVSVGVNGFVQLVETIGGVTFNIPHYMNYDDPTQNLHIHFSPGEQYINGYDAIKVVRWRQNNDGTNYGDIDRINTQQAFLKTVFKKCLSLDNLVTNLDDYIKIFQEYVKSDLTTGNMTWFAKEFLKLNMDNIQFHTMPSNYNDWIGGFSYGTVLVDEWLEMLNEYLNPYDQPITLEDVDLISRDENGELYATSGEIRGGMESFLTMEEYLRQLRQWNEYLESQSSKIEESTGNGGDTNGGE